MTPPSVPSPGSTTIGLRRLAQADLEAINSLERACYSVPWSRAMIASELAREHGCRIGAFESGRLVGQLIAARLGQTWHVMNVAVAPEARRRGIGSLLLHALVAEVRDEDDGGYTLEVRATNRAAIALYEAHGYEAWGRRPGYYVDNREDAIVMWRPPQRVVEARQSGEQVRWEPVP